MQKDKVIYIFVVHSIAGIGGMELYTAGMSKYLESQGCEVRVLTPDPLDIKPVISSMEKYIQSGGGFINLVTEPCNVHPYDLNSYLNLMINKLNLPADIEEYDIFIESCSGQRTLWAELLAAKLNARHIFIASEEHYREDWQCYETNLPFFYFKWKRSEIVGSDYTVKSLFNGYKNIAGPKTAYPPIVREADPFQDVDYPDLDQMPPTDWNICHIGRHGKNYVPHMLAGIGEFARRHPDKQIGLICVGDMKPVKPLIQEKLSGATNVYVGFCGVLSPIPRELLSKMDVVIGISQTAIFSANEGALTIVASATNPEKTPGLYGYDTNKSLDGEGTFTYLEALENVLVNHAYDDKKYTLPKLAPADDSYKNIWEILDNVSKNPKEYYTQIATPKNRKFAYIFPFGRIARGARIILFGATEIAQDYQHQLATQQNCQFVYGRDCVTNLKPAPYCEIVAIVDEHPEDFDDAVVGIERLKTLDYDVIVMTLPPEKSQATAEKILQFVPEMKGKVILNLEPFFV